MTTFFITGANRGIGLELARQAVASGARVFATARQPAQATALQALAEGSGDRVRIIELDVADEGSIARAAAHVRDEPIDVLINNAGVIGQAKSAAGQGRTALDMEADEFLSVMRVNVLGPLLVTRALLRNLRAAHGGKVAVISSMMGSFAYTGAEHIAYSTSKTAVNRLFAALALELAGARIPVAILSPGWVRTDMGGPNATLTVEESAAGLLREIARTDMALSGAFRSYAGATLTW